MSSVSPATTSVSASSHVFTARRTESQDIPTIIRLMNYMTERLFGRTNVVYLLETANLAVTLINQKNAAVAHAIFLNYPNWNCIDQAYWRDVLVENYGEVWCTPLNTLFLHLFVATDEPAQCCHEIMKTVFRTVPELHFILFFIPSQEHLGKDLVAAFQPVMHISDSELTKEYRLFMCERHRYCPQLYVRQARVEDHDDLTPLFTRHNDTLRETYGEFFIAELIEAQDDENFAVVCEDEGKAVGFMSVCSEVDIQLLHDCFDLGPFHGLCKPHPDDILKLAVESGDTAAADVSSVETRERSESTDTQDTETRTATKVGSLLTQCSESSAGTVLSRTESLLSRIVEFSRGGPNSASLGT